MGRFKFGLSAAFNISVNKNIMFYTKLVWHSAIPTKFLPSIKKGRKVSSQLLYFCQAMNLQKFTGAILVLFMFANAVPAVAQDTWSLQRCVDYALANNISVKQQDVQKRLADLTLKQSQLSQLPNLNGGVGGGLNFGRTADQVTYAFVTKSYFGSDLALNLDVNVFNWFSKRNTIAANRFEADANGFLMEKARNDLSFNVANAFLQILLYKEQVKVNEVQVKLTRNSLDNTRKLVIAGAVPESNQADLEASLAQDSTNLVTAQNNEILSILQMKALLNLGFDIPFQPEVPPNVASLPLPRMDEVAPEMVYSAALTTYPLIKTDELRISSAKKSLAAAKGALMPSLSLTAGMGTQYSENVTERDFSHITKGPITDTLGYAKVGGVSYDVLGFPRYEFGSRIVPFSNQLSNNFNQNIALRLRVPIFNGWQQRANVNRAKLEVYNRELTRDLDDQKLRQDIYSAHANAIAAIQKYNASTVGVTAAQKSFDFATKRYNLGLLNTIDYITIQTRLFKAQIDKVSAQYDYIFKMKLLEFYRDQKITL
jgi:outer membrane protein